MDAIPRFAVVGHPNKGKSSIVATLTQNDAIPIALEPGTTRDSHAYPLRVDGQTLYALIDTPGFQRPRRVLDWLQQHSASASDRPQTVQAFVRQQRDNPRFHDECALLEPILAGAGILYVVDGSVPYSAENEAEMTILRWTGQPRMALINRIGHDDHIEAWRAALGQYFQIVREFDAVRAPFQTHLDLLRAFGELAPAWREPLQRATEHLRQQRRHRAHQAERLIAEALAQMLAHRERKRLNEDSDRQVVAQRLAEQWRDWQRKRERKLRQAIERLYLHHDLERTEASLDLDAEQDLFSEHSRNAWGVSRRYLVTAGAGVGAVAGAGIDAATLGHSLGLGTVLGGLAGAAGGFWWGDKLARFRLGPLGGEQREAVYGPVRDPQFGYVVLGRALEHAWQVAHRNHAARDPLAVAGDSGHWLQQLDGGERKALHKALQAPPRAGSDGRRRDLLDQAVQAAAAGFARWQANA